MNCCKRYLLHAHVIVLLRTLILVAVLPLVLLPAMTQGQVTTAITSDGSLGSQVTPNGNIHNITGGTRPGEGPNLFHSFEQFSIGAGDIANFLNETEAPTDNILSRVTGGDPSQIFGTIQTTDFGSANLFLLNPAGVLFGPTASLDVGGSFYVATADFLRLGEGGIYYANLDEESVLTIAPPEAFGFLGPNPAKIAINQSFLEVFDDESFSLVGGDIEIAGDGSPFSGSITAPSGQINIASVASEGEVILDHSGPTTHFNVDGFAHLGEVELTGGVFVDVSDFVSGDGGGTVIIRGGQLTIDSSFVFADTTKDLNGAPLAIDIEVVGNFNVNDGLITADVLGAGHAGDIRVAAGDLYLRDIPPVFLPPEDFGDTPEARIGSLAAEDPLATGETGDVSVMTGDLRIEGREAEITTTTGIGPGKGGDIQVTADNVSILGTSNPNPDDSTGIFANAFGGDLGGSIQITADNVELANRGSIQSATGEDSSGDAGGVTVTLTGNLDVREGSFILGDSDGTGRAADLEITAKDISITGIRDATDPTDRLNGMFTGIDSSAGEAGEGGNVNVIAANVRVTDQGIISTSTSGKGNAGDIDITTGAFTIAQGAVVDSGTSSTGQGGAITLNVETFTAQGETNISTTTTGEGTAGNVTIQGKSGLGTRASEVVLNEESQIVSDTEGSGDGGNVVVLADTVFLGGDAEISSDVEMGATGDGGTVTIEARTITLQGNPEISTDTEVGSTGSGGQVRLEADEAIRFQITPELEDAGEEAQDPDDSGKAAEAGVFTNAEGTGDAGTILIMAPLLEVDGGVITARTEGPGTGGNVDIEVDNLKLINGAAITAESSSDAADGGGGGAISVEADESIQLIDGKVLATVANGSQPGGDISLSADQDISLTKSQISVQSEGLGNAGDIQFTAVDTILLDGASITTEATQASGGNIKLTSEELISLNDSIIESSVQGDENTKGGDINLDPDFIILQNSQILAQAEAGRGGNITLIANDAVLVDSFSRLDASSALGISGSVNIQAPTKFLSGAIVPLEHQPVNVATLYGARCVAGAGGHFSTFVDSKTDSLSPTPGTFLASPLLLPSAQAVADTSAGPPSPVVLTASIAPLVLGHAGAPTTACP